MRKIAQRQTAYQKTKSSTITKPLQTFLGQSSEVRSILHLQRTVGSQAIQPMLHAGAEKHETGQSTSQPSRFAYDFSRTPVCCTSPVHVQPNPSMEALFQQDFSNVKLHTHSTRAEEIGANAFTQGAEIHFAPGQYNPHSSEGRHLIAHELTHVVQQRRSHIRPTNWYRGNPVNDNPQFEREADHMGLQAAKTNTPDVLIPYRKNRIDAGKQQPFDSSAQVIQKDDDDSGGFDIDYSLLPPSLQLQLWVLSLDANTSRVRLSRDFGSISAGLNYNYGGALSADIRSGGFSSSFGVNPSNADLSLSGSYGSFNLGATGNISQRRFGLNLNYGAPLLPFPSQLSSIFMSGEQGMRNIAGDIASAPNNPLAWYDLHSDDVSTIMTAINTGRRIHKQQTGSRNIGAGLRITYSPESGLLIYGGVQLIFRGL